MNKLTITDIAKLCGVGKSTVSRVLNNEDKVSDKTRKKVLAVIQQYDFQPSRSAQAMRGIKNKVIGIIVTRLDSPAENRVLRGILSQLAQLNYEHFIVESRFQTAVVEEHLQSFHQRQIDGIIMFGFSGLEQQSLLDYRHKLVVIARQYSGLACVYYDDIGAITILLNKLVQQGHQHISYIGIEEQDYTKGYLRHQAYLKFCHTHRLQPCVALGKLDYTTGYQLAPQVLQPQTSAILCATDSLAFGVNKYLAEQQHQAIQVCSVGDNALLQFLFPNTLSINFGFFRAGQSAVRLLDDLLIHKQITHCCVQSEF